MVLQMARFRSFCGCIIFPCVYKPHRLYPLVGGCCLHALAIANNAAVSTGVWLSSQNSVFIFFRIAGSHDICICKFFEEHSYCFLYCLHQFTIPATVYEGSLSSTSLPTLVIFYFIDNSRSNRGGDISWWFWFAFLHGCVLYPKHLPA